MKFMLDKHFFKILFIFIVMILIGLAGVFFTNRYSGLEPLNMPKTAEVAK